MLLFVLWKCVVKCEHLRRAFCVAWAGRWLRVRCTPGRCEGPRCEAPCDAWTSEPSGTHWAACAAGFRARTDLQMLILPGAREKKREERHIAVLKTPVCQVGVWLRGVPCCAGGLACPKRLKPEGWGGVFLCGCLFHDSLISVSHHANLVCVFVSSDNNIEISSKCCQGSVSFCSLAGACV